MSSSSSVIRHTTISPTCSFPCLPFPLCHYYRLLLARIFFFFSPANTFITVHLLSSHGSLLIVGPSAEPSSITLPLFISFPLSLYRMNSLGLFHHNNSYRNQFNIVDQEGTIGQRGIIKREWPSKGRPPLPMNTIPMVTGQFPYSLSIFSLHFTE